VLLAKITFICPVYDSSGVDDFTSRDGNNRVDRILPRGYAFMPMRKSVFTLFIHGALLFGLSFGFHAEDLPETPYDESQGVACEHAPLFLTRVLQDFVQRTQPTQKSASPLLLGAPTRRGEMRVVKRERSEQPNCVIPTIPAVPLRC
jgi:hypothetical protein